MINIFWIFARNIKVYPWSYSDNIILSSKKEIKNVCIVLDCFKECNKNRFLQKNIIECDYLYSSLKEEKSKIIGGRIGV